MKIGIYCGSFNPVHKGHIQIANAIIDKKLVDKVLIVPTGNYWEKNDLLPLQQRIEMLQLFENEHIEIETKLNHIQATYDGFCAYQELHPNRELSLIVGADNLERFDKWINYKKLLLYPFIIIKRDDEGKEYIDQRMKDFNKENYTILDIANIDISSTFIREHIDEPDLLTGMIDEKVYQYIKEHRIDFQ